MGALKAFREADMHFDAIAGSSAGALNAAILATEQSSFGEGFWRDLSFRTVCGPTNRAAFYLLLPLHVLGLLSHGLLPFSRRQRPRDGLIWIAIVLGVPLAFMIVLSLVTWLFSTSSPMSLIWKPLVFWAITGTLWTIPFVVRAKGWSLLHMGPLRAAISHHIAGRTFSVPTYATLAHRELRFDPDQPGFYHVGGEAFYVRRAMEEEQYVPTYVRLDELAAKQQTDVLVASAALPFGVFPSVQHHGVEYIDGGIADNLPVYPLVESEKCDELIVIRVRPHADGDVHRYWQRVDRCLRLADVPMSKCRCMYEEAMKKGRTSRLIDERIDPPVNFPYNDFPRTVQVDVVAPDQSLGRFLSGTMNFRRKYARKLLRLGYQDAKRFLVRRSEAGP